MDMEIEIDNAWFGPLGLLGSFLHYQPNDLTRGKVKVKQYWKRCGPCAKRSAVY